MGTISPDGQSTSEGPMVWASVLIWGTASRWFMAEVLMILRGSRNFPSRVKFPIPLQGPHHGTSSFIPLDSVSISPQTDAETKTWENLVYEAQTKKGGKSTLSYQWACGCGHLGLNPTDISWEGEEEHTSEPPHQRTFTRGHHLPWAKVYSEGVKPHPPQHIHTFTFLGWTCCLLANSPLRQRSRENKKLKWGLGCKELSPTGVGELRKVKSTQGRTSIVSAKHSTAGYLSPPSICI